MRWTMNTIGAARPGRPLPGFRYTVLLAFIAVVFHPTASPQEVVVSDAFAPLSVTYTQGWGKLGINTATYLDKEPKPLCVAGQTFEKGIGHHANGEIVIPLQGKFLRFTAKVGVQWMGGGKGSVIFRVIADGQPRFESPVRTDSDAPLDIALDVTGVRELKLAAADAGDGISCDMADWLDARLERDPNMPDLGAPRFTTRAGDVADETAVPVSGTLAGFAVAAAETGPQLALLGVEGFTACLAPGEAATAIVPLTPGANACTLHAECTLLQGRATVALSASGAPSETALTPESPRATLEIICAPGTTPAEIRFSTNSLTLSPETAVRWTNLRLECAGKTIPLSPTLSAGAKETLPPPASPEPRPALTVEMLRWDYRLQDGIATEREPRTYREAVEALLPKGAALLDDLGEECRHLAGAWHALETRAQQLNAASRDTAAEWETLWTDVHALRREMAFSNPLANTGPLLFVKQAPGAFSHQLTQVYGRYTRPGGGIYALETPGRSMQCREIAPGALPLGSREHLDVSFDGKHALFAYSPCDSVLEDIRERRPERYYHIFEADLEADTVKQLTEGQFDDFAPRYTPDGGILFVSTRRGGFHRCGSPGCETYTLTRMNADGTGIHSVSFHETQEWDPTVLNDGRILYTRWDYVDRNAVHYQQLWHCRPDGSAPAIYFGNNTLNPVGVWEARAIPGSDKVMATAAAHHAMTAGSIILLDTSTAVDGLEPITRLTPDTPFPESESPLAPAWRSPAPVERPESVEQQRWPGHCYKSAWPLSETYFIAAYSFDRLIGEAKANKANMFGLYLVDAFGNKELLYRDLNMSSLWPMPLKPRPMPPALQPAAIAGAPDTGTYFLQDVYKSMPLVAPGEVKRLRIVQVLPKSTSGANNPMVGLANASPGKQVLGTVPVEEDGSAYFTAPARKALEFQALDAQGRAIQMMRSVTYLQPGENASCVGCHEPRLAAPPTHTGVLAQRREPSPIEPAPDGGCPLSYPILVQPVLDTHCIQCHGGETPKGPEGKPIRLEGGIEGHYTYSYNALAPRVPFSSWGQGVFPAGNCEPLTQPGAFGARASKLMDMLLEGHHDVKLTAEDQDRLTTWMDANALFYGTFNFDDQARQQRGERIAGPDLE